MNEESERERERERGNRDVDVRRGDVRRRLAGGVLSLLVLLLEFGLLSSQSAVSLAMAREVGPDEIRHSSKGSALLKRGETELSIDTSGLQRFLPKFLRFAFADVEAEKAYRIAYESEKRRDFTILVAILFYVNIVQLSLLGYSDAGVDSSQRRSAVLIAHSVTLIVTKVAGKICSHPSAGPRTWFVLPLIMWLIEATHIICDLWFYPVPRLAADSVSWVLLYTYTIYVIFPLRFRYCCLLALSLNLLHLALLVTSPTPQQLFPNQVGALFHSIIFLSILALVALSLSLSICTCTSISICNSVSLCHYCYIHSPIGERSHIE